MEQVDQLHPNPLDDLIDGDPGGRELRDTVDPPEVVRFLKCHLLMVATTAASSVTTIPTTKRHTAVSMSERWVIASLS